MATDRPTGTAQVAGADEIRIPGIVEELPATVREQAVFTRRVRPCYCTMVDVALAVDMIHGGRRHVWMSRQAR